MQHSAQTSGAPTAAPKRPGAQTVSTQTVAPKQRRPNVTYHAKLNMVLAPGEQHGLGGGLRALTAS